MAYRRSYGRRYKRRATSRVRTVTGKSASFVKLPSYKNMAYRGNERSGVLHEIKFVKQIAISYQMDAEHLWKNYIFCYVNCMEELIKSADFQKYASQYQDYCPYAVTVSATCPISLVGNCLLTNKLYDWPYFSTLASMPTADGTTANSSYYKQYLLPEGQFYSVGNIAGNQSALVQLSTFDTFFASHSTSKKLWNANIPYGVRYARYYATSAQKAMVNNIIQDAVVDAALNQTDGAASSTTITVGGVSSANLLARNDVGVFCPSDQINNNLVDTATNAQVKPYQFDQDTNVMFYLWSLQRQDRGQFNPFYYIGVNCNQTNLNTEATNQILTLTFKFYVYFKNEITDFFTNVAGSNARTTGGTVQKYLATVNDQAGDDAQFALNVQLQQQLLNYRRLRQNLMYANANILRSVQQWTIKDILRYRVQNTKIGNYLLSVYRDDPTIYAYQRNGFVIDESCYNPSLNKYVFQGYVDLSPNGNANYLLQNRYEPEAETTDAKFITNYAQTAASTAIRDDMVDLNVAHTCPQWSQILSFADYSQTFATPVFSTFSLVGTDFPRINAASEFSSWSSQKMTDFYKYLGQTLAQSLDFSQLLENIQTLDPYFYSQLGTFKVRLINANQYWDDTGSTNILGQAGFGDTFMFTHSSDPTSRVTWSASFTNSDVNTYTATLYNQWNTAIQSDISNLDSINKVVLGSNTFTSVEDFQSSVLIFVYCPICAAYTDETWSSSGTLTYGDVLIGDVIDNAGELYPYLSTVIPGGQFTNGQIVVFDQLVKDFVFQTQNTLGSAVYNGYDPTVTDLTTEDFYVNFVQISNFPGLSSGGGWYTSALNYQNSLRQAQTTFYQSIPSSASKVWKKIKGFFKRAWSCIKTVGKGIIKSVGSTLASAYIPGGAAVASTMVPSGIKDIIQGVKTLVVSSKKEQYHYINNRLVGITKTNSTGLVKVLVTPGICALNSAQPVDLDSPQFVDQDTYEVSSIDIGDVTELAGSSIRVRHARSLDFSSLPRVRVTTESGDEVDASFVQSRLKVQVYMDKPSEDFVLPTTAICVGCDGYYEEEENTTQ